MRRHPWFAGRRRPVLGLVVAFPVLIALAGCSSSNKASTPPSTSSTSTSTSSAPSTTAPVEPSTTTTTTGAGPATTVKAPVVFTNFTISPASPVPCNSPTMVELRWTAQGVSSVDLAIDGQHAATYPGGPQDHLQYFACDGKKHTYTLSAKHGTTTETVIRDVTSKPPS